MLILYRHNQYEVRGFRTKQIAELRFVQEQQTLDYGDGDPDIDEPKDVVIPARLDIWLAVTESSEQSGYEGENVRVHQNPVRIVLRGATAERVFSKLRLLGSTSPIIEA